MWSKQHHRCSLPRPVSSAMLVVVLLCGCDLIVNNSLRNASRGEAAKLIERHIDYLATKLVMGMPKEQALTLLPKPQNTNTQNVCVWVFDSTESVMTHGRSDWQWLQSTRGGFFVVFVDGRLATPLCSNAAFNPWQALQRYAKLSDKESERILGQDR